MHDCSEFVGRLQDLCDGVGRDGRPNPTQAACDRFRDRINKPRIHVVNPAAATPATWTDGTPHVSAIGTNMEMFIRKRIGAMPCGKCKARIIRLNRSTVAEAEAGRETLIAEMKKDSVSVAGTWWLKAAAAADKYMHLGGTEYLLNWCLSDAIAMEIAATTAANQNAGEQEITGV